MKHGQELILLLYKLQSVNSKLHLESGLFIDALLDTIVIRINKI